MTDPFPLSHADSEVTKIIRYKAGYVVQHEKVFTHLEDDPSGSTFLMKRAYNPQGNYIGSPHIAYLLCKKRGIAPELSPRANCEERDHPMRTCSIGFSQRDQKWYGWSHRALYGFSVGDVVKEGDCTATSGFIEEYLAEHPEDDMSLPIGFKAESLADAKRMAIAFAESVG